MNVFTLTNILYVERYAISLYTSIQHLISYVFNYSINVLCYGIYRILL